MSEHDHASVRGPRSCCSDLDFDRLILRELDREQASALHLHFASSPPCLVRYQQMVNDHEGWQQQPPPLLALQPMAPVVRMSAWRRPLLVLSATAAAAAAVVAVRMSPAVGGDVQTKGSSLRASFSHRTGADIFDGDAVALPANVVVAITYGIDGAVAIEFLPANGDATQLVGPQAVIAGKTTTAALTLPASLLATARGELRVVACPTPMAIVTREGCTTDPIAIVFEQGP